MTATMRVETQPVRDIPDRIFILAPGMTEEQCALAATQAVDIARTTMPRLSGNSSRNLQPVWGHGYFGIRWASNYVWFQEQGIRPFTMRNLAGKVIPMWINDPLGSVKAKNPKADTRVTADGRRQTKIFRRAAKVGARRTKKDEDGNITDAGPQSWPGAPGRISRRTQPRWWTGPQGQPGGRIARFNVGVRWRHPGLPGAHSLHDALLTASSMFGVTNPQPVYSTSQRWRGGVVT